ELRSAAPVRARVRTIHAGAGVVRRRRVEEAGAAFLLLELRGEPGGRVGPRGAARLVHLMRRHEPVMREMQAAEPFPALGEIGVPSPAARLIAEIDDHL